MITNRPAATFRLAEESETQTIQCSMDNQGKVVASKLSTLNLLGEVVQIGGEALTSGEWVAESVGRIVFGDGVLIRENRATIRLRGNGELPNLPIASNRPAVIVSIKASSSSRNLRAVALPILQLAISITSDWSGCTADANWMSLLATTTRISGLGPSSTARSIVKLTTTALGRSFPGME